VRYEREKRSLSQDTLALSAGVSPKTVKRIEAEEVGNPRPVTIRRIAEALGVDPDQLRPPTELEGEQLDRLERKINLILDHFDLVDVAELEQLAADNGQAGARPGEQKPTRPGEASEEHAG
jgi:transcriptional regulator with XRE-family HTH domain